jgi:ABC-2 type transport system ATP-binding protein
VSTGAIGQQQDSGPWAIEVRHLSKRYAGRAVVDDVSFRVAAGEVFALLGPNGAGKTTTVEILEGYRRRDGGEVRVLGLDPERAAHELRRRIGLMLQEGGIYPQARPREILALFASFYARPDDPDRLLTLVGLDEARRTPYRRLSGGQKQRLALALALVGRPALVFLDEPTAGMDPQARRATWAIIDSLRAAGVTVLLTTHLLDEAEQLADHVAIIDRGRLVALGGLAELRGAGTAVLLTVGADVDPAALAALPGAGGARRLGRGRYRIETATPAALLVELTTWAARQGVPIRELRAGGESLEEIYFRLTERADEASGVTSDG